MPFIFHISMSCFVDAILDMRKAGVDVSVQLMMTCVFTDHEVDQIMPVVQRAIAEICAQRDVQAKDLNLEVGAALDVPRACIRADKIARAYGVAFVSFDTENLTQMVFGLSKSDTQQFMVRICPCTSIACTRVFTTNVCSENLP